MKRYFPIIFALLMFSNQALAFGAEGHRIITMMSASFLDPAAKGAMAEIMGKSWRQEWIASSNWAAEQEKKKGYEWMTLNHRAWFEVGDTEFDPEKHCPKNQCSVAAILGSMKVLKNDDYSQQQKRKALKYIVHYVGDIHQPTNCGFHKDMSGRKILLETPDLQKVNLHWIWERALLSKKEGNWSTIATVLRRDVEEEDIADWQTVLDPKVWAWDCHVLAKEVAYKLAAPKLWGNEYFIEAEETLDLQLKMAAVRTAGLLNKVFEGFETKESKAEAAKNDQ